MIDVLALCAGVGGIELGLHLALPGHVRAVGYVERDARAASALVARMGFLDPAPVWDDVATFDGRPWRGVVDLVAAGFPCQPWSESGKRRGAADERFLWPDILRVLTETGAPLGFFENVRGLDIFGVRASLRAAGYRSRALLLEAAQVGAPQGRERVFILAYAGDDGREVLRQALDDDWGHASRDVADGRDEGLGSPFPPGPDCGDVHPEPFVCRGTDGTADRVDRVRMLGNGVVPLAAAYAFGTLATQALRR